MSKTAKGKPEKHGKSSNAPTATPQSISEIIPGKFTDNDWFSVIQLDENEDAVAFIVDEIKLIVDEKIKAIEIERQLAPYTVSKVMDFMLDLFRMAYPEHQNCQQVDMSWEADIPPECSMIDNWAEGTVPKQIIIPVTVSHSQESLVEDVIVPSTYIETEVSKDLPAGNAGVSFELVESVFDDDNNMQPGEPLEKPSVPSTTVVASKPKPYKPNVSVLSVRRAVGMDVEKFTKNRKVENEDKKARFESASTRSKVAGSSKAVKTALIAAVGRASLQREKGRPPMEKDVNYDAYGNIISMIRISPEAFPPLFVHTDFMVVDPRVEKANAELEAMRTGRYIQRKNQGRLPVRLKPMKMTPALATSKVIVERQGDSLGKDTSRVSPSKLVDSIANSTRKSMPFGDDKSVAGKSTLQGRTIIEQIDLSPGVDMREGTQEKRGADIRLLSGAVFLQQDTTLESMTQRPQVTTKLVEVNQLVNKPPVIKPIA